MAAPKKKKKKPAAGATGAPPRSEPKVQLFSKFAGCNFQLSTRNFDDIFDTDQDAQTDLMPMYMAIQNNADIVPMGGIETRQEIVQLFSAPNGTHFTGVVTLIGDRLYAACSDMTIHHDTLPVSGIGAMASTVTPDDQNSTYSGTTQYHYSGTVT